MAELFEEVVALLESRSCTRALAEGFRIESEQAASNGAVLGVPIFLSRLGEWTDDATRSASVLKALRTIDTSGLQDPGATVESRSYDPIGSELADTLLGDGRHLVATVIAGEAGVGERSANALLAPTAWAVVASIADRYGSRIDRQSLLAILKKEEADLLEGGWGPWLDATGTGVQAEPVRTGGRQAANQNPVAAGAEPNYPPPVSRSARQAAGERPASRSRSSLASGPEPVLTGSLGQRRAAGGAGLPIDPDHRRRPPAGTTAGRSALPALLGVLLLFLLGAGAIYLLLRDGDEGATGLGTSALTDGSDGGSADGEAGADGEGAATREMVALDIMMDDPEGRSTSTGIAELRFEPETGEICYNVTAEQIGSPYDGHIHAGPAGEKGGIVVDFGPLNNADIGCVMVSAPELASILADPEGHYVEMHDPSGDFTIRAQLSEAMTDGAGTATGAGDGTEDADGSGDSTDEPAEEVLFDPDSGGAVTVVESGRVVLRGPVADQATADRLLAELADVDPQSLEVVDELTIDPAAPVPTGLIRIDDAVLFDVNSDQLSGQTTVISDLAVLLQAQPTWRLTVVGHTDSTGEDVYNLELSLRRATAVRDELVANGIDTGRLTTRGDGSTDPVGDNDTAEGRAQNRRIEFIVDRG